MEPKLRIEIEAVDKASATLEKAAKELQGLSKNLKQFSSSATSVGLVSNSFQKLGKEVDRVEKETTQASGRFRSLSLSAKEAASKSAAAFSVLEKRVKALQSAVFNLKTIAATALSGFTFSEIVKGGIEFNSQLQTAKLGLAALITSAYELRDAQGQVLSGMEAFKAAQAEAEELYRKILYRAMQTASTSQELLQTFQAILPFAAQMGMSLEQVLNLSEALVNAAKAIGLGYGQAAQEGRDLLMGYVDQNDQLLRALGLNRELLQTWKEQGTFYENVMGKFRAFVQASQEFADTWEGVTSSVSDLISMLEGSVFKDTFHVMNEALKDARDYLQGLLKDEEKLKSVSKEVALKFIHATESVIVAADSLYSFGKSIYDFVNSHKEITEFGVLGYLLLGKRGALLGTVIGGIAEIAEKSKRAFPTTSQMFEKQPNIRSVLGISGQPPQLPSAQTFKAFEEYKRNHPKKLTDTPVPLPVKTESTTELGDAILKKLRELEQRVISGDFWSKGSSKEEISYSPKGAPKAGKSGQKEQGELLSTFEVTQSLLSSQAFSLFSSKTLEETLLESVLNKKELFNYDFGLSKSFENSLSLMPDYSLESLSLERQTEIEKASQKLREQYLEFAKERKPQEWKKLKLSELREWYEEQKRILGESEELQEVYEHKRLEIEKTAHEQEKKLYIEKLRQTSSWKAGVFQSLDELSKKWGDTNQLIYDATTQTFQALENSLETIFFDAMRGKLKSLGDYVNSFLASVESAIAGIAAHGVASSIVKFGKSILGFTAAEGGIIQGHFIPLKAFANGGVVDRPTLGLVGEGKYPEAIVPLLDKKSIRVVVERDKAYVPLPSGLSIPASIISTEQNSSLGQLPFISLPAQAIQILKEIQSRNSERTAYVIASNSEVFDRTLYYKSEKNSSLLLKSLTAQLVSNIKAFANGGVVDRPTLGLVGEGKYPEAVVPLPDGRSIPVKFEGKGGNGQVNIEIVLVDDRSKVPAPQIGKKQVILWVAEDYMQNGILRKVIKA